MSVIKSVTRDHVRVEAWKSSTDDAWAKNSEGKYAPTGDRKFIPGTIDVHVGDEYAELTPQEADKFAKALKKAAKKVRDSTTKVLSGTKEEVKNG